MALLIILYTSYWCPFTSALPKKDNESWIEMIWLDWAHNSDSSLKSNLDWSMHVLISLLRVDVKAYILVKPQKENSRKLEQSWLVVIEEFEGTIW